MDELLRARLIRDAQASHAAWPQYEGYFDGWVLGRITRRWRSKGGSTFSRGQLVLVSPTTRNSGGLEAFEYRSVYCEDTHNVCAVELHSVRLCED